MFLLLKMHLFRERTKIQLTNDVLASIYTPVTLNVCARGYREEYWGIGGTERSAGSHPAFEYYPISSTQYYISY